MRRIAIWGLFFVLIAGYWQECRAQGPNTIYRPCARVLTGQGQDSITWSANPCANFDYFIILGNNSPGDPLLAIDTVFNSSQTGIMFPNGNEVPREYQVLLRCGGVNTDLTIVVSNQRPVTPELKVVTINNGIPFVEWSPSPSPSVTAYQVYQENPYGSGLYNLDMIMNSLNYLDVNNTTQPVRYAIAAESPCNESLLSIGDIDGTRGPHTSIFLQAELEGCSQQVRLSWNPYENWQAGVDVYQIWVSTNGAPAQLLDTTSDTTYIFDNFNDGDVLEFFIRALEKNNIFTSNSNVINLNGLVNRPMDFLQLTNVTVDPASGGLQIDWSWDTDTDFERAALLRGTDPGSLSEILSISAIASEDNSFLDTDVSIDEQSYYYQVRSIDACGQEVRSNWGASTLIEGKVQESYRNELHWTDLQFQEAVFQGYELYKEDNSGTATRVATINAIEDTLLVDRLEVRDPAQSTSCYYVVTNARLEFPNGDLRFLASRSNTICLDHQATLYFPNALTPFGRNPYFRPVVVYGHTLNDYNLQIYNRYGKLVFETDDYRGNFEGVDMNGKVLQQGAYVYVARYTLGNGKSEEQKGTVMIIR